MTSERVPDFHKAAGILIKDRKLLVTQEEGKAHFISPGGIVETGETPEDTVIRELKEEVDIDVSLDDLEKFGEFWAQAAGVEDKLLKMEVFLVNRWIGEPIPAHGEEQIAEIRWIDSQIPEDIKVGSIFEHEVIPRLKEQGLID